MKMPINLKKAKFEKILDIPDGKKFNSTRNITLRPVINLSLQKRCPRKTEMKDVNEFASKHQSLSGLLSLGVVYIEKRASRFGILSEEREEGENMNINII